MKITVWKLIELSFIMKKIGQGFLSIQIIKFFFVFIKVSLGLSLILNGPKNSICAFVGCKTLQIMQFLIIQAKSFKSCNFCKSTFAGFVGSTIQKAASYCFVLANLPKSSCLRTLVRLLFGLLVNFSTSEGYVLFHFHSASTPSERNIHHEHGFGY